MGPYISILSTITQFFFYSQILQPARLSTKFPSRASGCLSKLSCRPMSHQSKSESDPKSTVLRIPMVGSAAPAFSGECVKEDGSFSSLSLSEFKGKKHVVLLFYPLDFTFVCPSEILAFSDAVAEFEERKTQVLGISVDSVYCHNAWRNLSPSEGGVGKIKFPLVGDLDKKISRDYGVLFGDKIALRGMFIIEKNDQKIVHQLVNDLPLGRSVEECLRTIDMLDCVQNNGGVDVCPANWRKGKKTMKATIDGMKIYLKDMHAKK